MQSLLKYAFSTVIVTATLLAMTPLTVNASEHKYPIFERQKHPNKHCQGDKELVWIQGQYGTTTTKQECRQKCPDGWITTKMFCIKDTTVSFPNLLRVINRGGNQCAGGEKLMLVTLLNNVCIETCPDGMKVQDMKDDYWCVSSSDAKSTGYKLGTVFNYETKKFSCEPGMDEVSMGKYLFCLKPLKAK